MRDYLSGAEPADPKNKHLLNYELRQVMANVFKMS